MCESGRGRMPKKKLVPPWRGPEDGAITSGAALPVYVKSPWEL
jgi:hypothetical protein